MSDLVTPCLRESLRELDRLRTPTWIVDLELGEKWWCNRAGLTLWNAASLDEWIGRNATNVISEATRTRLHNLRRRFDRGEVSTERWTFYPDGIDPVVAEVQVSGVVIADAPGEPGRMAMLVEARPLRGDEVDPAERRGYEALRYLGEPISYYGPDGEALMRNPAAIRAFGDCGAGDQLLASFVDPAQAAELRAALAGSAVWRADVLARTTAGEQWFDTEARASLDPVTGNYGVLVTQRDISERRAHLEELERRGQLLAAQAEELRHLAAPVLRLGPGVLALPLIGALDRARIDVALAALLARTGREPVKRVVLDLTGAAAVDLAAADGLLRIVRVLQLQGVTPALSGIHPELAQAIVRGGLELGGVRCFQSLADALTAG
jgi:rsbT co-antagonist protein RsbR